MAVKEQSFVLKKGEGIGNKNLIKHTVIETPRGSSVDSTPKTTPILGVSKSSYVSPMMRARQLAKQRREGGSDASKDWDESTSSPSSISSGIGTPAVTPRLIPYSGGLIPSSGGMIPSSGYVPKSGYIPKSGPVSGEDSGRLPKFGVWDNHNDDNGPCYTLLFENMAQEKRIGGPIRIHAPQPCSPAPCEDLYNYNATSMKAARKTRHYPSLLCCFVGS
jgi:hypothetical protein